MLYGYLLYLHALLNSIGSRRGAERAGGAGRRFWRHSILVDGVAGPVADSRVSPRLLAVALELRGLLQRLLLVFLDRGTPRQGRVRRRGFLSGSRILRGLDGRPGGQWQ